MQHYWLLTLFVILIVHKVLQFGVLACDVDVYRRNRPVKYLVSFWNQKKYLSPQGRRDKRGCSNLSGILKVLRQIL